MENSMTSTYLTDSYIEKLQAFRPNNKKYVEKFLSSEHGGEPNYISQTFRFVKYFNDKLIDIDQLTPDEIDDYFSNINSKPAHIVNIARFLSFFLNLLPEQDANIALLTKIAQEKQKEISNKEPISIHDLITFRNKLIAEKDYKTLFIFEMLYVYGLKWKDLENITEQSYSPTTGELKVKSKGKILLTADLKILLKSHASDILIPQKYETLSKYLRDASNTIGYSITETVIEETRKRYFPICQRCNTKYPNTSDYWALVKCKDDAYHNNWLICVSCAREIGE